ncbi:MAG: amidohydrolase family protein [Candidatus Halalkalibacterium sp. M3_1C_030]
MKSLLAVLSVLLILPFPAVAQIAVKGETVYTMNGETLTNGVVLVKDGKIERVGSATRISIPDSYTVYEAAVVSPGLVDARTVVGLAGIYNQDNDQDQLETSNAIQPQLRAIDAYNAREELVSFVMDKGVTTIHTGHGPGALASGQTMIAKTGYNTVEEAVVETTAMIAMTLGSGVSRNFKTPGTRAKGMAMLRQKFIEAQEYAAKRDGDNPPPVDLEMETLADVLDGNVTALITAQKANDIMTALRLRDEFGFNMVLDGAAEAYHVLDEIKEAGVPVIVHPTMVRTYGDTENASFETAGKLHEAGIPFAFQSGYEGYVPKTRIILFEAAIAVANGLPREAGLRALTLDAAKILGIDNRVGSIAEGKDADLVLYDGDPFEYTTHVARVLVDGKVVKGM